MRAGLTKGDNADGNKRRFLNSPDFATYVENGKDIALMPAMKARLELPSKSRCLSG